MMTSNTTLEQAVEFAYHMLPEDGGQTVEVSYYHADDGYLYCRSYDRSDLTLSITRTEIDEAGETPFEPWNGLLPETTGVYTTIEECYAEARQIAAKQFGIPADARIVDFHGEWPVA